MAETTSTHTNTTTDTLNLGAAHTPAPALVAGVVAYDDIITPYASEDWILGGSATFAALAASFFAPAQLVGIIGNDFKAEDIARLKARNICLKGLEKDENGLCFHWAGKYHENFITRDTLDTQLNVIDGYTPKVPTAYTASPYVMLANTHPLGQLAILDAQEAAGNTNSFVLADTMNFWIDIALPELEALLKRTHCICMNDEEATMLTHQRNLILAGQKLLEMGPTFAIVKKGEHGAYLFAKDAAQPTGYRLFALPAYPVTNLQDPTGAGDSFAGAIVGALSALCADASQVSFEMLAHAMLYGTAAASLTVEAFSTNRLEAAGSQELAARAQYLKSITQLPALQN